MKQYTLSEETADINVYESPICEVHFMGTLKVICDSDTEHVGEDEGEW